MYLVELEEFRKGIEWGRLGALSLWNSIKPIGGKKYLPFLRFAGSEDL